jgi:hypothetical protein
VIAVAAGHSYDGIKITGVGQTQPKIASLVYRGVWVPDDGQPLTDTAGPPVEQFAPHAERITAQNTMALAAKDFGLLSNTQSSGRVSAQEYGRTIRVVPARP